MLELLGLVLGVMRAAFCCRRDLLLENLLLRQQLAVALRPKRRLRLQPRDKLFWMLARRFAPEWRRHLLLVRPDTVVRWHRQGWRLFWRGKSRTRFGRPRLSKEVRDLIATMSRENVLWGAALGETENCQVGPA